MAATTDLFPITVIGSFPKPSYLKIPDWFNGSENKKADQSSFSCHLYTKFQKHNDPKKLAELIDKAYGEVVEEQIKLGIDVITDGELERENYIHYHCRHLEGFDFVNAEEVTYRGGATSAVLPKIVGEVKAKGPFLVDNFTRIKNKSSVPVKVTVPGPMTVRDTCNNTHYEDPEKLCWDIAVAINVEIKRLVEAGCRNIQVDEPLFARQIDQAHKFGFKCLDRCLEGVNLDDVYTTVHICCGYSDRLDQEDYTKAENHSYVKLAAGLDACKFHAVSIEDAHTRIPDVFFTTVKRIGLVLGCIQVVRTAKLSAGEIENRVKHIVDLGVDPKRLILAPDCGLAMMPLALVQEKMTVLNEARNALRASYGNLKRTAAPEVLGDHDSKRAKTDNDSSDIIPCC